jgi:hypothetical protein
MDQERCCSGNEGPRERLVQDPNSHNSLLWGKVLTRCGKPLQFHIIWGTIHARFYRLLRQKLNFSWGVKAPSTYTNKFFHIFLFKSSLPMWGKAVFEGHLTFVNIPLFLLRGDTLCLFPRNKRKKFHIPFCWLELDVEKL